METLSGKIAIVTGGTRGIGRAIAERLLREGVSVAICGRSQDSVEQAVGEMKPLGRIFGHPADVSSIDQVRSFFHAVDVEFGGLDILVNNAGQAAFRKVADLTPAEWHRNIDLNLNGPFYCSHEALPRFARRGGGFIVNISSLAGKNAFTGGAGYNASKAGLNLFTEALMLDHRHDNVRVCSIMPGSVDTDFTGDPDKPAGEAGAGKAKAGTASWMIAPADIAETVALVLCMPARTMISRVEMRPSRPQK
ncbi:MAG: SDR family oxidoreductase [Acidobacteriia bacterium]|nr:SDR family oxidoreductase [Terriglobia bacterium]